MGKFGDKLKELRKGEGLTQKEFSNLLDVSDRHLQRYESGTLYPPVEKLLYISIYFNVSIDYLLKDDIHNKKIKLRENIYSKGEKLSIGGLIQKLRGDMSIREASNYVGISSAYLDTIEKGYDAKSKKKVNPSPDTLRLISQAYNYSYEELLYLAGYIDLKDYDTDIKDIKRYIDNQGITDFSLFNIDEWKKLDKESIEEIKNHFEWVVYKSSRKGKK